MMAASFSASESTTTCSKKDYNEIVRFFDLMEFHRRLEKAIERGHRTRDARARAAAAKALSEKELARLHSQYRLELSERIEACLKQLADQFPGFRFETLVNEKGWGGAISRDDIRLRSPGRRNTYFSRLEMLIRPATSYHVLDLAAKATIRNKEIFHRSHFQELAEVDLTSFTELIDLWTLEYAELYAAKE
jgi:hypothetical protein